MSTKKIYLVEERLPDRTFRQHAVEAKTFEEACMKVCKLYGETEYRNCGLFEAIHEEDKKVFSRM